MSAVEIKQVVAPVSLGEGPHWEENSQSLLFVDFTQCDLHRYFPETGRHQILHVKDCGTGKSLSFVIPVEDDPTLLLIALGRSLAIVEWSPNDPDERSVSPKCILQTVDQHLPDNYINDGKCDPQGRVWSGTMGEFIFADSNDQETPPKQPNMYKGTLFSMNSALTISKWVEKASISNGLTWSPDRKTFYFIDSYERSVDAFDYNDSTGEIGNRRRVLDYKTLEFPEEELPDGMCTDEEGHLWVANYCGKKVICIDPNTSKILQTVEMPTRTMTSVCWGGKNYETLYATSTNLGLTSEELTTQPGGAVFAITGLGVKGFKPYNFKVDLQTLKAKFTK